jgi:hypothetical protein
MTTHRSTTILTEPTVDADTDSARGQALALRGSLRALFVCDRREGVCQGAHAALLPHPLAGDRARYKHRVCSKFAGILQGKLRQRVCGVCMLLPIVWGSRRSGVARAPRPPWHGQQHHLRSLPGTLGAGRIASGDTRRGAWEPWAGCGVVTARQASKALAGRPAMLAQRPAHPGLHTRPPG